MEYMTIIAMILFGIAYGCLRERAGRRALALKALATSMAVTAGLYGAVQSQDTAGWLIVAGLVLCMIADVVLEIRMVGGIGIFGAGHLCFIAAFWLMSPPTPGTLLLFLAIYVAAIGMFRHEIAGLGGLKVPAFLYMAVLGFMVSMAVTSGWHIGGSIGLYDRVAHGEGYPAECLRSHPAYPLLRGRISDWKRILDLIVDYMQKN